MCGYSQYVLVFQRRKKVFVILALGKTDSNSLPITSEFLRAVQNKYKTFVFAMWKNIFTDPTNQYDCIKNIAT